MQHLVALESLDDPSSVAGDARNHVALDQQNRLHDLLLRHQADKLTEAEREQLSIVQQQADLVMLRKARAASTAALSRQTCSDAG